MKIAEHRPLDDQELELLFAAARQSKPQPSDELLKRVVEESGYHASPVSVASAASKPGPFKAVLDAFGGIPAAIGFATATAAGLAIGFFASAPLDGLSSEYLATVAGFSLEDIMPSFIDLIGEV